MVFAADSGESLTCWPEMSAKISAAEGPSSWRTVIVIVSAVTPWWVAPPLSPENE